MAGEVNFGLLNTDAPYQIGNSILEGNQNRLAYQTNQLAYQNAQQANEEDQAARNALRNSGGDPNALLSALQQAGAYKTYAQVQQQLIERQLKGAEYNKNVATTAKTLAETAQQQRADALHLLSSATDDASWTSAVNMYQRLYPNTDLGNVPQTYDANFVDKLKRQLLSPDKQLPVRENIDLGGQHVTNLIDPITGLPIAGTAPRVQPKTLTPGEAASIPIQWANANTNRGMLGVAQGKSWLEGAPITAPVGGYTGSPAAQGVAAAAMAPQPAPMQAAPIGAAPIAPVAAAPAAVQATGFQALPPKEIQKREAIYPQASNAVRSIEQNTDQLIQQLEKLKAHPGLSGITGVVNGRTPNVTAEARDAQALLDNIMAKGQFAALQALKEGSSTGSTGIGPASDTEEKALRSSAAAVSQLQSTPDFQRALNDWIAKLQLTKANIRDTYNQEYAYRGANVAPVGTAPGATPMYASKPGGPRLQSTDGGKTWTAVGGQ